MKKAAKKKSAKKSAKKAVAPFAYQAEKLSQARRTLMAPHSEGEDQSFANAFHACWHGLRDFDEAQVEYEEARRWIKTIKETINTEGVEAPTGTGAYLLRSQSLSIDEKREFSDAVDELAHFFEREFWSPE